MRSPTGAQPTMRDGHVGLVIIGADVRLRGGADVRIRDGIIVEIDARIRPTAGEAVFEARGGALLPGLRDHHLHLRALGAARRSLWCGPPSVTNAADLVAALRRAASDADPDGWIRGIGYHESVAGPLDRSRLDAMVTDRPVRIQHRSGQLWTLNSFGIRRLGLDLPDGRLWRGDHWLRDRLDAESVTDPGSAARELASVGLHLAALGVTGVTDATVTNGPDDATALGAGLTQQVVAMGDDRLAEGPRKVVLHDDDLPPIDELEAVIRTAHERGRVVAVHCVTRPTLWFALAAFTTAGSMTGDRIEHGSVIPPEALAPLRQLGLTVVTQPNFASERGDAYAREVDSEDRPWLYRVAGLLTAGIPVAGGTDAPFGDCDPWRAMVAAVERRTGRGAVLGAAERVSPEQALDLFTGDLDRPGRPRVVAVGAAADLCLLTVPWRQARAELSRQLVAATIRSGQLIYRR